MRNVLKNKFLLCFRPVVDIDAMLESKVASMHGMKKQETKSVFFQQGSPMFSESWIMHQPPKRTLCRVIKAVVCETILKRRTRHKNRYRHESFGSKHSYGSPQSPLSSSSSCGSTPSSLSPQVSESKNLYKYHYSTKEKQKENGHGGPLEKQKKFEFYGICLVLISLVFTVFWGKLFGIVLTSIWLYFFSVWNLSYRCQKRLPSCPRQKSIQAKYKGHYGRSAPRELPSWALNF